MITLFTRQSYAGLLRYSTSLVKIPSSVLFHLITLVVVVVVVVVVAAVVVVVADSLFAGLDALLLCQPQQEQPIAKR